MLKILVSMKCNYRFIAGLSLMSRSESPAAAQSDVTLLPFDQDPGGWKSGSDMKFTAHARPHSDNHLSGISYDCQ
jgi:hypothetical protein